MICLKCGGTGTRTCRRCGGTGLKMILLGYTHIPVSNHWWFFRDVAFVSCSCKKGRRKCKKCGGTGKLQRR